MLDLDDTLEGSIQACEAEETEIDKKVQTAEARQRYLQNLTSSSDDTIDAQEDSCILCRCEFVRGFMTQWLVHLIRPDSKRSLKRRGQCTCLL